MGRPPIGKVAMTGAERTRLYRLKHATAKPAPKPTTAALERELAAAKARIAELEKANAVAAAEIATLKAECWVLRERKPAKPKAEKPPLPPDEQRDRQIKGLTTANRNLRMKLAQREQHYQDAIAHAGGMPRETRTAFDKLFQPDARINATLADLTKKLDAAAPLWNTWKNDNDKARRRVAPKW
jgi:hypothetical protein